MKRREFVNVIGAGALLFSTKLTSSVDRAETLSIGNVTVPPLLKPGSKVAFTAPGSFANEWETRGLANFFQKNGCSVVYGETITKRDKKFRYLSNDDEFRADELNKFFSDPAIHCIVAARGGYGSIRILDKIDYEAIRNNPKIFIGFSDITVLLNAITKKTNLMTFHGPTGNYPLDNFTATYLKRLIFESDEKSNQTLIYKFSQENIFNKGESFGQLVGGNLSNLVSILGTEYDFDTDGKILFFEEISEPPYKIDRMLKQLELAGKFSKCKGILLGNFGKLDSRRNFYPDYSLTLREIFQMYFKKYNIPILINFPFGHNGKFITFPIGSYAEISTEVREFSLNLYHYLIKSEKMFNK